jgi:hypothetical protein
LRRYGWSNLFGLLLSRHGGARASQTKQAPQADNGEDHGPGDTAPRYRRDPGLDQFQGLAFLAFLCGPPEERAEQPERALCDGFDLCEFEDLGVLSCYHQRLEVIGPQAGQE